MVYGPTACLQTGGHFLSLSKMFETMTTRRLLKDHQRILTNNVHAEVRLAIARLFLHGWHLHHSGLESDGAELYPKRALASLWWILNSFPLFNPQDPVIKPKFKGTEHLPAIFQVIAQKVRPFLPPEAQDEVKKVYDWLRSYEKRTTASDMLPKTCPIWGPERGQESSSEDGSDTTD